MDDHRREIDRHSRWHVMDEKEIEITEEQNNEDNSKEQKPKPSISPNKDFYFVW